ncbi:MAG TPA: hypothetical protein VGO45_05370 [Bacteroidia bacterium]|jgi:hypothetical protein|nr:hypothetical protein [Bacteroidia bacterium]
MASILFLITLAAVFILLIRMIRNTLTGRQVVPSLKLLAIILGSYGLLWLLAYSAQKDKPVPFGTDICFDDWCATVLKVEKTASLGTGLQSQGSFYILHVRMSNHALGIAQKPSEPRIHIVDSMGHSWSFSKEGQQALESGAGRQPDIGMRLQLGEKVETKLVFDIPAGAKGLTALIEEGPFITKLLLPESRQVFVL